MDKRARITEHAQEQQRKRMKLLSLHEALCCICEQFIVGYAFRYRASLTCEACVKFIITNPQFPPSAPDNVLQAIQREFGSHERTY